MLSFQRISVRAWKRTWLNRLTPQYNFHFQNITRVVLNNLLAEGLFTQKNPRTIPKKIPQIPRKSKKSKKFPKSKKSQKNKKIQKISQIRRIQKNSKNPEKSKKFKKNPKNPNKSKKF